MYNFLDMMYNMLNLHTGRIILNYYSNQLSQYNYFVLQLNMIARCFTKLGQYENAIKLNEEILIIKKDLLYRKSGAHNNN